MMKKMKCRKVNIEKQCRGLANQKSGRHQAGFTLTELIVVIAITAIMLGVTIFGILAWQDWATFNKQNEYAQNLFIAAQNQLTEYGANGKLKLLQREIMDESDRSIIVGTELTKDVLEAMVIGQADDGQDAHYVYDSIWPESVSKAKPELYQDKIVAITADAEQYSQYLNDPVNFKKNSANQPAYWVFELLGEYIYDTSILDKGAISIEFTPEDGQVFSAFYSEKNTGFTYGGDSSAVGIADLINRSEKNRRQSMVGFYGVDSLYASTENKLLQPKISKVMLHNEETLYLTYKVTKHNEATQLLNYDITLLEDNTDQAQIFFTLDGTKIKNAQHAQMVDCDVLRYEPVLESGQPKKDTEGNVIYDTEGTKIGTFPILAYIQTDKSIRVLFDAADIQATTFLYKKDLDIIRSGQIYSGDEATKKSKFADTYSIFRFGMPVSDIYASVKGYGTGYKPTNTKASNTENSAFEKQKVTVGSEGATYQIDIKNGRHLYNMRYYEDLTYEQQAKGDAAVDAIASVGYQLVSDVDFEDFQRVKKQLFDSNVELALSKLNKHIVDIENTKSILNEDVILEQLVTRENCEFPSISQLRSKDTVDGKNKKISGIAISELSNGYYGIYTNPFVTPLALSEKTPVGLFNVNYGTIKDLSLDNIHVSGSDFVGGFCGVNAGQTTNLATENSNKKSKVTGISNVGGLIGFQMPTSKQVTISKLKNRVAVEGVKAVGGILGMVRNEFNNIEVSKLPGYTSEIGLLLNHPDELNILVTECENYGSVLGCNRDELVGIYTQSVFDANGANSNPLGATLDEREKNSTQSRYIGGIVGYCYNQFDTVSDTQDDTEKLKIENCISSPQMADDALLSILSDEQKLENKQKGVYVGGIVGYNHFGQINSCSAKAEKDTEGYLFGYRYVGGIVGMNIGPASGIVGATGTDKGTNENHVIAYEYAGGITGCNASVLDKDSLGNDISVKNGKDPESLVGMLKPDAQRSLYVKIDNWINKGIVIATNQYAGGITGYNAGMIYGCNSEVEADKADKYFDTLYSGDYAGGVAGYNNGVVGNTLRKISSDGRDSSIVEKGKRFSTVCYVKGHNYVGGIVGYNDVDSVIEDYEIASGYVLGDKGSCFVGGYAGLNASIDLLMEQGDQSQLSEAEAKALAREIHSNPNRVEGSYFVGGNIGGNMLNTNGFKGGSGATTGASDSSKNAANPLPNSVQGDTVGAIDPAITSALDAANSSTTDVYAIFDEFTISGGLSSTGKLTIYNEEEKDISGWKIPVKGLPSGTTIAFLNDDAQYNVESGLIFWKNKASCEITTKTKEIAVAVTGKSADALAQAVATLTNQEGDKKQTVLYTLAGDYVQNTYIGQTGKDNGVAFAYEKKGADKASRTLTIKMEIENKTDTALPNGRIDFRVNKKMRADRAYASTSELLAEHNRKTLFQDNNANGVDISIFVGEEKGHILEAKTKETIYLVIHFKNWGADNSFEKNFNEEVEVDLSFNNVVYDGPSKDESLMPTPTPTPTATPEPEQPEGSKAQIYTYFKTDNFLGTLEGEEFVGGFVGYNLMFDAKNNETWITGDKEDGYRGGVFVLQKKIVDAFNTINQNMTDTSEESKKAVLIQRKNILDDLNGSLGVSVTPSDRRIYVSGKEAAPTTTTFGKITGQIFVGGVLGYNDEETSLYIEHVENATPVLASMAVSVDKEQIAGKDKDDKDIYRKTNYLDKDMEYTYSYAGGIVGKVTKQIIINNCLNTATGDVQTIGTYTGGLCEINEGTLFKCSASSFGSSVKDYVGGLCGLNKATIEDCKIENKTISGRNVVGGIVAENFGTIKGITMSKPKMNVAGVTSGVKDGVAGLYAAYNGKTGRIILSNDIVGIDVKSSGNYVGGIAGINAGTIDNKKTAEKNITNNIVISGKINGRYDVGALVGLNLDENTDRVVSNYTNAALVIASNGNAGGIIGENASNNAIQYCVNDAAVSATNGNAGGITSANLGKISYCYDYKSVSAPKGKCGGIASVNGSLQNTTATIENCFVKPNEESKQDENVIFESANTVGGITAANYGLLQKNTLEKILVQNLSNGTKSSIGVVVGDNYKTGRIYFSGSVKSILECEAIAKTNECYIGGVAGTNDGLICNPNAYESGNPNVDGYALIGVNVHLDGADFGSLGGVAGENTGTIAYCQVDSSIIGDLGDSKFGYGGIAGYSGYTTLSKYEAGKAKHADESDYHARIIGCTFDGTLFSEGSSDAPANAGGITGANGYGGYIENCAIGVRISDFDGKEEAKTSILGGAKRDSAENIIDNKHAYNYLGGIAGINYGEITKCDMNGMSDKNEEIEVIGFAGAVGGMVGMQYASGNVFGYKENNTVYWVSTPANMKVQMLRGENDYGVGGLIGYSKSPMDVVYLKNYANVSNYVDLNVKTGGVVGTIEQQKNLVVEIKNCENYAKIEGAIQVGGIIGRTKFCSVRMLDCTNEGEVYASKGTVGGLISRIYDVRDINAQFINCVNHGYVHTGKITGTSQYTGGFLGSFDSCTGMKAYLTNCDNTGIVERDGCIAEDGTVTTLSCVGSFIGTGANVAMCYFDTCQNYNTSPVPTGFIGQVTKCNAKFTNCLDDSNLSTDHVESAPFGGIGLVRNGNHNLNNSTFTNVYVINEKSKNAPDFVTNAGAYFTFGRFTNYTFNNQQGISYQILKNPALYLEEPSEHTSFQHDNSNRKLELNVSYDETKCQGMDALHIYYYHGNSTDAARATTYSFVVTFKDIDGKKKDVEVSSQNPVTAKLMENKVSIPVPDELNKKITNILIAAKSSSGSNIYYRGFTYTPAGGTKEAVCDYITARHDTSFDFTYAQINGNTERTTPNNIYGGRSIHYNWELFGADWSEPYHFFKYERKNNKPMYMTIDVQEGENAPGMDEFVMYGANNNNVATTAEKNIRTYNYEYEVTFTDVNGKRATVIGTKEDGNGMLGYDSAESDFMEKSKCVIKVPADQIDKHIKRIEIAITNSYYRSPADAAGTYKTNDTNVFLRGFAWKPVGASSYEKLGVGPVPMQKLRERENAYYVNQLYCDYENAGTAQAPYLYVNGDAKTGFKMRANDPAADVYYNDKEAYKASDAQTDGSNSRLKVYRDVSEAFENMLKTQTTTQEPLELTGVTALQDKGAFSVNWTLNPKAYAYEVKYVISRDEKEEYASEIYTIGSGINTFSIQIKEEWKGCAATFYVKAVNGYRYTCAETETNPNRYDSPWVSARTQDKVNLHTPIVHLELTPENKMVAVLENRDDYLNSIGEYIDCNVTVNYNNLIFTIPVATQAFSTEAIYLSGFSITSDFTLTAQTTPSADNVDYYTTSALYYLRGHMVDNALLLTTQRYTGKTYFRGFYGDQPDQMTYQVHFQDVESRDSFIRTDIMAKDPFLGIDVSYATGSTHVASTSGKANFVVSLSGLPKEWFADDFADTIVAREYLESSQYHAVYYGHVVEDNLVLSTDDIDEAYRQLDEVTDPYHFFADGSMETDYKVWDNVNHTLLPGYTLQYKDDQDETHKVYEVYYNASIELAIAAAAEQNQSLPVGAHYLYYNHCVDYKEYSANKGELVVNTYDVAGKNQEIDVHHAQVNKDNYSESYLLRNFTDKTQDVVELPTATSITKTQEMQPSPIIESFTAGMENNHKTFTIHFDEYYKDTYCMTENNKYATRNYYNANGGNNMQFITQATNNVADTWDAYLQKTSFNELANNAATQIKLKRRIMNSYYTTYANARYKAELIGKTLDGQEAVIDTQILKANTTEPTDTIATDHVYNNVTYKTNYVIYTNAVTFADNLDIWGNYSEFKVRITHLGEIKGLKAMNTSIPDMTSITGYQTLASAVLPRYTEKVLPVKFKFNTISKPSVTFGMKDGQFVTDTLAYDVVWGALTDDNQVQDLGGYLISVKRKDLEEGESENAHYFYITEIVEGVQDRIALDEASLDGKVIAITPNESYKAGDTRKVSIDLSDYSKDDKLVISIKAIAREKATLYEDGEDGVETEIVIPNRLAVPKVNKVEVVSGEQKNAGMRTYDEASCIRKSTHIDETTQQKAEDEILENTVTTKEYEKGVSFSYQKDDENYKNEPTAKISLAIAVFDDKPEAAENDVTTVLSGDAPQDNDGKLYWNSGAYRTLYTKSNGFSLSYANAQTICNIDLLANEFEQYRGEFANKWLKIAMKAESTTRIDSQWTDQDQENAATVNYLWIHLPKHLLDDVHVDVSDCEQSMTEVNPYVRYLVRNQVVDQEPESGSYEIITVPVMEIEEDIIVDAYMYSLVGKKQTNAEGKQYTPVYNIYLQKSYDAEEQTFDGTWDVYLSAGSEATSVEKARSNAAAMGYVVDETISLWGDRTKKLTACRLNEEAIYVGNIGKLHVESDAIVDAPVGPFITLADMSFEVGMIRDLMLIDTRIGYRQDANGIGKFVMILPEVLTKEAMETERTDDTYIGLSQILIQKWIDETYSKNHYLGDACLYANEGVLQDNLVTRIWHKRLYTNDKADQDKWFAQLEAYLQKEKEENETQDEEDPPVVSANSIE